MGIAAYLSGNAELIVGYSREYDDFAILELGKNGLFQMIIDFNLIIVLNELNPTHVIASIKSPQELKDYFATSKHTRFVFLHKLIIFSR